MIGSPDHLDVREDAITTFITATSSPDPKHGPASGPGALPLSGLTVADTIVLRETVRSALLGGMLGYRDPAEITASAEQAGLGTTEIREAFAELHRCSLIAVFGDHTTVVRVDVTPFGFLTGFPAAEPRAEEISHALITDLLGIDLDGPNRWLDVQALADRYGTVRLAIEQLLGRLMDQGQIGFLTTTGGCLLTRVNPALRRELR
ncbi:hypothetical protein [Kitasatospora griseola]|uniref:hypothetical protein n=1 Tax=Kitasatospora griseola TaxID=2064 RepID=UPI00167158EB|nr:hypothetical protein [Kitasatospora griseola]GGR05609.1 hypothetical protein GCM10010195_71140 [Kitasatospora griseola]